MRKMSVKLGNNAGKIWVTLSTHGPLTQSTLIKTAKLTKNDFHTAIGWLARENKIYKEGELYKLGETNLTNKIGEDAGKIWKLIDSHGEIDISSITKEAKITIYDAYSALGWLACENKIDGEKIRNNSTRLKFKLKYD